MTESKTSSMLFVCTGNTCRSPMAAYLMAHLCRTIPGWNFASAGIFARNGQGPTPEAVKVMEEKGLDLSSHKARLLTLALMENIDWIIPMTRSHADTIAASFPEVTEKVFTLHSFTPDQKLQDVMDPFSGSLETYRKTRDEIESALSDLILSVIKPTQET